MKEGIKLTPWAVRKCRVPDAARIPKTGRRMREGITPKMTVSLQTLGVHFGSTSGTRRRVRMFRRLVRLMTKGMRKNNPIMADPTSHIIHVSALYA